QQGSLLCIGILQYVWNLWNFNEQCSQSRHRDMGTGEIHCGPDNEYNAHSTQQLHFTPQTTEQQNTEPKQHKLVKIKINKCIAVLFCVDMKQGASVKILLTPDR
ncbi:unnamed protein product, partial [Owenia fusiformis]